jgi:hypothetical protein
MSSIKSFYAYLFLISALAWSPCYGADPCMIKLDINIATDNNDANTQAGFTPFILADSGSEVNGVTIDIGGDIESLRRPYPSGMWAGGVYYPRAGERIYRDFISGVQPSGVTITLYGLGVNRDCNITIWAFDSNSSDGSNRIANWYANGVHILDTSFIGGSTNWPNYEVVAPQDLYKWAFKGRATADEFGRIVLTSSKDPCSPAGMPFAFVNALVVEPNVLVPFVPTKYACRPVPFDGIIDVPVDVVLAWKKSVYAEKHDVYFGTDFNDVNDANRTTPLGVLVSENQSDTTYTPSEILDTNVIYYWRIDEVNSAPDYAIFKGQVWSFTTHVPVLIATNPAPLNGAQKTLRDVTLNWEKGEYAEKHDVYFGTDLAKVNDANRSNPLGVLVSQNHLTTIYDPPKFLDFNTTYYWRIDEVNTAPDYAIFKGNLWTFTTYEPTTTWRVDARCFENGPPGSFDNVSVKDPSIVYAGGKWRLFYTFCGLGGQYAMGYASATTIAGLRTATHYNISNHVHGCAPNVFWFEPQSKWYLIHYKSFSTNTDINDPNGWTESQSMGIPSIDNSIDHSCISDGNNVYIFSAPDDGRILRRSTTVADFPYNWSEATVVATDTFEGPAVYKNLADGKFYMITESLGGGISRYYELWTADNPGGTWTKVEEQWAHKNKLVYFADHWTDQVSHGELLRAGTNERMEISDIERCQFLIQGVVDGNYSDYGNIPYELGVIRPCIASMGDLDYDYDVDFVDYAILTSQWLQPLGIHSADIEPNGGDGIVDIQDLYILVVNWLWEK